LSHRRRSPLSPALWLAALATAGCLHGGGATPGELHRQAIDLQSQALDSEGRGLWREAVTLYQQSIEIAPTPVAHCRLALCQAELGALESAENHLQRALELSPSYQLAQTHLLRVKAMRGAPAGPPARGTPREGVQDSLPITEPLTIAQGSTPSLPPDADAPQIPAAQDKSTETEPAPAVSPPPLPSEQGDQEVTGTSSTDMPTPDEVRALLFPNLHGQGGPSGAELLRQTRLDSPDFHMARAAAHESENDHVRALREYRLAFERDPTRVDALLASARLHSQMGHLDKAMETYERAQEMDPENAAIASQIGNHHFRLGEFERAKDFYEQAVTLDPGHRSALNNLGAALLELGRLEEAIRHLQRAVEIDPDYARPHKNLGNIHAQQGDGRAALEAYRRYVSLGGRDAQAVSGWIRDLERDLGVP
jgi:tetratricopeptide (TPR) repeat protein